MNLSRLSLATQLSQCSDRLSIINSIQTLLLLMKKFGKALNSPDILSVISQKFPDAFSLYTILGKSRCSIIECQQLLVSVSRLMDHNHLNVVSSIGKADLSLEDADSATYSSSDIIGLSVVGKGKIYKRTLNTDLQKLSR